MAITGHLAERLLQATSLNQQRPSTEEQYGWMEWHQFLLHVQQPNLFVITRAALM